MTLPNKLKIIATSLTILAVLGGAGSSFVHTTVDASAEELRLESARQDSETAARIAKLQEDVSWIRQMIERHFNEK